ncbi:MAG TPA: hypothetical protein VIK11_09325 [Tepidiformaceae bacterium]|jgi:hypothetical protein
MEPVSNLNPIAPPPAHYPQRVASARSATQAAAPSDRVDLSDEALAASGGEAKQPQPQTYGPRGTFTHDSAARQAGLAADTNRSRHLSDIMSEIAAVQQRTAELLDRQHNLRA